MEFFELVKKRYSVRAYRPDPVKEEDLHKILEAAVIAPTAANRQPFMLVVAPTKGREEDLKKIYGRPFFTQAPIVIGICAVVSKGWVRSDGTNYSTVDCAIVMDHLILAATDLGLGTCWVGAFDPQAAKSVLGLPPGVEPIAFTPLGYPADKPAMKSRKPAKDLVRFERW